MARDSALNNLEHSANYRTAAVGALPEIVRRGSGPIDLVIIPGLGFGARDFDAFMQANESRYRMICVTLPGFAGTPAPPMPAAGTSYGDATWTRAAEGAIAAVIARERLRRPVILGHLIVGTQVALRLALDHPEMIGGVVIVGGQPMQFAASRKDSSGRTPMSHAERLAAIDGYTAPRWFKTVTKETFDANNYFAMQYSRDSARALRLWKESAAVPLPVMVRYLIEYMAMDLSEEFARVRVPTKVLVPSFDSTILADKRQAYVKTLFIDSWDSVHVRNPGIAIQHVPDSRIFITDDQPAFVQQAIDDVATNRITRPRASRFFAGATPATPSYRSRQ